MFKKFCISFVLFLGLVFLTGCQSNKNQVNSSPSDKGVTILSELEVKVADRIEVVHFHGAQQCWSCITVGEYAHKTIKEKFPEEYENGTISFKDINGELPDNKDMVLKYKARGSALFINAIIDGRDNIEEDTTVWRLVSNEDRFTNHFENKIKNLLGK